VTYTSHGHHIPGTTRDDEHGQVNRVRCGGPALCTVCQKDTARYYSEDEDPDREKKFYEDIYDKDPDRFFKKAKLFVIGSRNNNVEDETQQLSVDDLYIVWWTYTLGNWKAMISTSIPGDGLYFEVTHNEAKDETYVDTYLKIANDTFSQEGQ